MKNKMKLLRSVVALLAVVMLVGTTYVSAAPKRLQGGDRYETAVEISRAGWPETSKIAVLAYGEAFPDALCAGPLASVLNAPILLTGKNALDPRTKAELERLNTEVVHIVGGTGVVSTAVENQLADMGIKCNRIAGADRYETSKEIAWYIHTVIHAPAGEVFVVNGEDFPDAVSVSPIAAKGGSPIILACPFDIPAYDDYIKEFIEYDMFDDASVYIVGGSDTVKDRVVHLFPQYVRIQGADAYQRNAAFINYFADRIDFTKPFFATGETFPDALAGSALAVSFPTEKTSPIILAGKTLSIYTKGLIKDRLSPESQITVLGGPGALSDSTLLSIVNTIGGIDVEEIEEEEELEVEEISTENTIQQIRDKWNQYKPSFSGNPYIEAPVVSATHKAGILAPGLIEDGVNMANFVRFLAGLPDDLAADEALNTQAQHGAVLLAHIGYLDHTPAKPADMDESFYKTGYKSTSTSNISFAAMSGSGEDLRLSPGGYLSLSESVRSYMSDSDDYNVDRVGHRRWIINPELKKTGFGFAHKTSVEGGWSMLSRFSPMQAFDTSRTEKVDYDHVKWPNNGYFPAEFFAGDDAWSISFNPEKYSAPQLSQVGVELKRQSDNKVWILDKSDNQIVNGQEYFNINNDGYGIPYCIIFRPNGLESYNNGDVYDVKITGIKDKKGSSTVIQYQVKFFNVE